MAVGHSAPSVIEAPVVMAAMNFHNEFFYHFSHHGDHHLEEEVWNLLQLVGGIGLKEAKYGLSEHGINKMLKLLSVFSA